MTVQKSDLLQGTLDLLILKTVALGPVHGYGISQRKFPAKRCRSSKDRCTPRCTAWKSAAGSRRRGANRKAAARRRIDEYFEFSFQPIELTFCGSIL